MQPQSSPKRSSPWRRALQKLTPPRKSTQHREDPSKNDGTERKKVSLFSSPVKKFQKRSKRRKKRLSKKDASLSDEDHVVTVQVLPKSPLRDPNMNVCSPFPSRPLSPPRILKTSLRTLETENAFDEMFQSYIDKFHNHGALKLGSVAKCKVVNQKRKSLSPHDLPRKVDLSSAESTSETSCSVNDVRIIKLISKEVSDLTLPRPIRDPMSTLEVLSRFTFCVSEVANALVCPCVSMSPPAASNSPSTSNRYRGPSHGMQMEDIQDFELDSDSEYATDNDEDDDNDGVSTSTYNSASSS